MQQQGPGWGDDLKTEVPVQVGVDVLLMWAQAVAVVVAHITTHMAKDYTFDTDNVAHMLE